MLSIGIRIPRTSIKCLANWKVWKKEQGLGTDRYGAKTLRHSPQSFCARMASFVGVVCVSTGARLPGFPVPILDHQPFAWILISPFGIHKISGMIIDSISILSSDRNPVDFWPSFCHLDSLARSYSVANSVCLVTTSSLWTGLIALIFLRKKPSSPLFWISCLLGIRGVGILTGYKTGENGINFWGDGMALIGAVCMAVYLRLAQGAKDRISFSSFLLLCYGSSVAFLWLFLWLVQSGPSSVQSSDWIFLIALAIVSQVMGHGIYNWCIRWMDARMVALSLLGEPVGATFLAWMFVHNYRTTTINRYDHFADVVSAIGPTFAINENFHPMRIDGHVTSSETAQTAPLLLRRNLGDRLFEPIIKSQAGIYRMSQKLGVDHAYEEKLIKLIQDSSLDAILLWRWIILRPRWELL